MNNRKRAKRQSLKAYLANSHKWTATFCKYTDTSTGTIVQTKSVDGAGRVRVPHGWFVSFFRTGKELAKGEAQTAKDRKRSRLVRLNPNLKFRSWDVANGKWITETEQL